MSNKAQVKKQLPIKHSSVDFHRTVPFENGFHFYTSNGNYTGITATNLSEFSAKLQIIPAESVTFHFHRKDFQNWIKNTIKFPKLAESISKLKGEQ